MDAEAQIRLLGTEVVGPLFDPGIAAGEDDFAGLRMIAEDGATGFDGLFSGLDLFLEDADGTSGEDPLDFAELGAEAEPGSVFLFGFVRDFSRPFLPRKIFNSLAPVRLKRGSVTRTFLR